MKAGEAKQGPFLRDFNRDQNRYFLVKRFAVHHAGEEAVVVVHLFGGGKQSFMQAFSLDSWVIAGCYDREVVDGEQVKQLLEVCPRYEAEDKIWAFLVEKAKTGRMGEARKRSDDNLGVRGN